MSEVRNPAPPRLIRTLVVDDSAFVRKVVREILTRSPFIEVVGMARDGEEALAQAQELKPDVITCDLIMPRMDGVEFVRRQMQAQPLPILILTSSPQDANGVLQALEAGAVDLVQKPTALATNALLSIREELVEKVKAAAGATHLKLAPARSPNPVITTSKASRMDILVIGISTGGPQALRFLFSQIPADFPVPIAMVLHMPVGYTKMFAEKLNEISPLAIKEAEEGDLLEPGKVLLAQAGQHLLFKRSVSGQVTANLSPHPSETPHRPAVDVLFESATEVYGSRVLAVVMTGMGDDGKQGAAWVKAKGGTVLTEAEESCVIYGMPRVVVEAGLTDGSYTLEMMLQGIAKHL